MSSTHLFPLVEKKNKLKITNSKKSHLIKIKDETSFITPKISTSKILKKI